MTVADSLSVASLDEAFDVLDAGFDAAAKDLSPFKTVGLWVSAFPLISQAWARGEITDAHVKLLRSLHNRRTDLFFRRDESLLTSQAKTLSWPKFETACQYWLLHADPDGQLPTEREISYGVKTKTHTNGDVEIAGRFDPITGEALLNALDHEDQKLFRQTRDNPDVDPVLTALSHRRRRSVALMNLISRGFARNDGTHPIPLINVVMSQNLAEGLIRWATGDPDAGIDSLPLDPEDVDRRCETIRGTPLDPRRMWPLLFIGQLRRQIFTAKGTTANYSSGWTMLTADHTTPWSMTKHTCVADGSIKCDPCNNWKSNIAGRS